jgi:hypothetical protein
MTVEDERYLPDPYWDFFLNFISFVTTLFAKKYV